MSSRYCGSSECLRRAYGGEYFCAEHRCRWLGCSEAMADCDLCAHHYRYVNGFANGTHSERESARTGRCHWLGCRDDVDRKGLCTEHYELVKEVSMSPPDSPPPCEFLWWMRARINTR
jgi:hypothetical protein